MGENEKMSKTPQYILEEVIERTFQKLENNENLYFRLI
jgi:predicted DNA-binding protein